MRSSSKICAFGDNAAFVGIDRIRGVMVRDVLRLLTSKTFFFALDHYMVITVTTFFYTMAKSS